MAFFRRVINGLAYAFRGGPRIHERLGTLRSPRSLKVRCTCITENSLAHPFQPSQLVAAYQVELFTARSVTPNGNPKYQRCPAPLAIVVEGPDLQFETADGAILKAAAGTYRFRTRPTIEGVAVEMLGAREARGGEPSPSSPWPPALGAYVHLQDQHGVLAMRTTVVAQHASLPVNARIIPPSEAAMYRSAARRFELQPRITEDWVILG